MIPICPIMSAGLMAKLGYSDNNAEECWGSACALWVSRKHPGGHSDPERGRCGLGGDTLPNPVMEGPK